MSWASLSCPECGMSRGVQLGEIYNEVRRQFVQGLVVPVIWPQRAIYCTECRHGSIVSLSCGRTYIPGDNRPFVPVYTRADQPNNLVIFTPA